MTFSFCAIAAGILAHYSGLTEVLSYYPRMNQYTTTKPQLIKGNQGQYNIHFHDSVPNAHLRLLNRRYKLCNINTHELAQILCLSFQETHHFKNMN
jgi:hypothetical protein